MAQEDEINDEEPIIPEEDFREAIAACRSDPDLDRFFSLAPGGAKLFIGLTFYSTHFGDKVDREQFAECQAEIEPALGVVDLKYLIRFERDKETKKYLRELLAKREAEAQEDKAENALAAEIAKEEAAAEKTGATWSVETKLAEVVTSKRKRTLRKRGSSHVLIMVEDDSAAVPMVPPLAKAVVAALVAIVVGALVWMHTSKKDDGQENKVVVVPDVDTEQVKGDEMSATNRARSVAAKRVKRNPLRVRGQTEPEDPDEADARLHAAVPEALDTTPTAVAKVADAQAAPPAATGRESKSRKDPSVVFTDGKRIVRHPGGKVEVPRVFSCAGAGVKPFWIYASADPAQDAAKERKAREEWAGLCREAKRQADGEASE
jgi:hypothetical protein